MTRIWPIIDTDDPDERSKDMFGEARHQVSRGITAAIVVAAGLLVGSGPAWGTAAPARMVAGACAPEAPVCHEIRGVPGDYYPWFRVQSVPATVIFSFTVNGTPTPGSLSTITTGTTVEGEFWPVSVLVAGDRVCMRYTGRDENHCAITPG
ncbi:hypothetical protein [Nonomuraea sp. NPDC002799]